MLKQVQHDNCVTSVTGLKVYFLNNILRIKFNKYYFELGPLKVIIPLQESKKKEIELKA